MKTSAHAFFVSLVLLVSAIVGAESVVPNVRLAYSPYDNSRTLTIKYDLSADAIITLDIQTNSPAGWVSIGAENFLNASGDLGTRVPAGLDKEIVWPARASWPDQDLDSGNLKVVVTAWHPNEPPDYLVVDLSGAKAHRYYASTNAFPGGFCNRVYKTDKLVMKRVRATGVHATLGRNALYDDSIENYWWRTDGTQSPRAEAPWLCTFTNDYYLGVFEVTQAQFARMYDGTDYSIFKGENFPDAAIQPVDTLAENGTRGTYGVLRLGNSNDSLYKDCVRYRWPQDGHSVAPTSVIGQLQALTGLEFDLPTSAQWEFACRAGTRWAIYNGPHTSLTAATIGGIGWYPFNCTNSVTQAPSTHPVGLKEPNAWGFYDMLGNVAECCLDWHANDNPIGQGELIDPPGPTYAESSSRKQPRVCGGSWGIIGQLAYYARIASKQSAINTAYNPERGAVGFRLWLGIK